MMLALSLRFGPSMLVRKTKTGQSGSHWKGLTRAYARCKFGSCGAHLSEAPAFAPLMGAMVFHRIYILCNAALLRLQSVLFS